MYRELGQKGKMIGEFDILISAIVKKFDEQLVSKDADFKAVQD
jgi:predicted nucleic acid-binding protein